MSEGYLMYFVFMWFFYCIPALVTEGYLMVDMRKEKRLAKLMAQYIKAQDKAKSTRVSNKHTRHTT